MFFQESKVFLVQTSKEFDFGASGLYNLSGRSDVHLRTDKVTKGFCGQL
jgi:hypothetical protein